MKTNLTANSSKTTTFMDDF